MKIIVQIAPLVNIRQKKAKLPVRFVNLVDIQIPKDQLNVLIVVHIRIKIKLECQTQARVFNVVLVNIIITQDSQVVIFVRKDIIVSAMIGRWHAV